MGWKNLQFALGNLGCNELWQFRGYTRHCPGANIRETKPSTMRRSFLSVGPPSADIKGHGARRLM